MSADEYSTAEMMVVAMAREVEDGDCLAMGIGTSLPQCAYFLAKLTHAPRCVFLYSIGGTFAETHGPLTLTGVERMALSSPLRRVGYAEIVCDQLAGLNFKEFSRPAQVDAFGNTNNVLLDQGERGLLRFPGVGGIPDFSPYASHHSYLYLPRQNADALVERLDFHSGAGARAAVGRPRADLPSNGPGTRRMVTDLAVFEFTPEGASIVSLHPGVTSEDVWSRCGFDIEIAPDVAVTQAPTVEQLHLIRNVIDPREIRDLELLPSSKRGPRLRELLAAERAQG
jgi:acyl CoA:acetate/3-ketoacid CoA transferase beta subunit